MQGFVNILIIETKNMITKTNDIKYNNKEKMEIRDFIFNLAKKAKSYLDLYGNGEGYKIAKKKGINILSIDNGSSHKDIKKLKIKLRGNDKMFTSINNLCKMKMKRKHDAMWLDYCGSLSDEIRLNTIPLLPNIMAKKGFLFITFLCGREKICPKGTCRTAINMVNSLLVTRSFKAAGVKTKLFYEKMYTSMPDYEGRKKKSGTKMVTMGFKWEKLTTKKKK